MPFIRFIRERSVAPDSRRIVKVINKHKTVIETNNERRKQKNKRAGMNQVMRKALKYEKHTRIKVNCKHMKRQEQKRKRKVNEDIEIVFYR